MGRRALSVLRTLRENGILVTLAAKGNTAGRYDPNTGLMSQGTVSNPTRAAMLMDQLTHTHNSEFGHRREKGTLIDGVDKWMLMDAIGREPTVNDAVFVGDEEYEIVNVQSTIDKDGPCLYTLALKR